MAIFPKNAPQRFRFLSDRKSAASSKKRQGSLIYLMNPNLVKIILHFWEYMEQLKHLNKNMKFHFLKILVVASPFALAASCSTEHQSSASLDENRLTRAALNFNHEGAELGECGLVSQFEKGRASSTQSSGGG